MAITAINSSSTKSIFPQNAITAQKSANVASTQTKISNADGDTLKLSGNTQNVASKCAVYGPPNIQDVLKQSQQQVASANSSSNTDAALKILNK
jgi:hypothetical protein